MLLSFSFLLMAKMPTAYRAIMGSATNHIVTPLPSGVIIAPKTVMIIIAYLKFFARTLNLSDQSKIVHTLILEAERLCQNSI